MDKLGSTIFRESQENTCTILRGIRQKSCTSEGSPIPLRRKCPFRQAPKAVFTYFSTVRGSPSGMAYTGGACASAPARANASSSTWLHCKAQIHADADWVEQQAALLSRGKLQHSRSQWQPASCHKKASLSRLNNLKFSQGQSKKGQSYLAHLSK